MLELAIGIILAGCGIGAGLALIAGIGPGIGEGNTRDVFPHSAPAVSRETEPPSRCVTFTTLTTAVSVP